jgi:hypothetical protein
MSLLTKRGNEIYGATLVGSVLSSSWLFIALLGFGEPQTIAPVILFGVSPILLFIAATNFRSTRRIFPLLGAVGTSIYPVFGAYIALVNLRQPDVALPDVQWHIQEVLMLFFFFLLPIAIILVGFVLTVVKLKQLSKPEVTPCPQ